MELGTPLGLIYLVSLGSQIPLKSFFFKLFCFFFLIECTGDCTQDLKHAKLMLYTELYPLPLTLRSNESNGRESSLENVPNIHTFLEFVQFWGSGPQKAILRFSD